MFISGADTVTSENAATCASQDPAVQKRAGEAAATVPMTADKTRTRWKGNIIFPSILDNTITTLSSNPLNGIHPLQNPNLALIAFSYILLTRYK